MEADHQGEFFEMSSNVCRLVPAGEHEPWPDSGARDVAI